MITSLSALEISDQYQALMKILETDPTLLGDFLSSPVNMETKEIYPISNYGSAMSPFYTVLALWVGALILVAIIHVKVLPDEKIPDAKPYQKFFGRYITFFLIGQVQALITALGDLFYIKIQCHNPFLFWLACACCSFVFTLFMYALTVAFENVGEALAVVIMVIQVAGAGGSFPIEVLPGNLSADLPFLPIPLWNGCTPGDHRWYVWNDLLEMPRYLGYLYYNLTSDWTCNCNSVPEVKYED